MLVRTVECLEGTVEIELVCEPAFDYGRDARRSGRSSTATGTRADATGAGQTRPAADRPRARRSRATASGRATCSRHGERAFCALSWAEELAVAGRRRRGRTSGSTATIRFWRAWLGRARIPDHRWRDPIQRSALAIKGLTYMPTGATVAALTTSLPETPGGERNWDYRYTWMRDTTFTLQALHWLNLDWEADEFMQFVADLEPTEDGSLQIMYGIDGRRDLTETTRDDLSGYAGARPVRIGNGAFDQRQNDVFGAVLDSILLHTRRSKRLPRRLWPIVETPGRVRDEGLARARPGDLGGARQAAALRVVEADVLGRARPRREARRDPRRRRAAGRRGERSPTRSAPTSSRTASSEQGRAAPALRRPTRSTRRCSSPRSSGSCPATTSGCAPPCYAIAEDLTENGFVLRYRTDETDDGLSGKEGTFLICSFWLVSALADRRRAAARPRPDGAAAARSRRRSVSTPRSSTPTPAGTSATSRRRSRIWR